MKVCILGTGLSALALAKALVNENIKVDITVLNKKNKISQSRTLGISKSNIDYFNNEIINISSIAWKLKKIEILSDNFTNEKILNFENNNEQLFSIIKNYQLYNIINKSLSNSRLCKRINLGKKKIDIKEYELIINTDNSNYFTKKYFNKKIVKEYDSTAYTTIIKHKEISNNIAVQIFTKKGPLAFLPVSKNETSIVFSIHNSKFNNEENIINLIKSYNFKYKIKSVEKIDSFKLKSLVLRSYYHDNILAFGDLLHRVHPLAGQGFNMTIRDIKNLMDIIKGRIELGLPLDKFICREFEKKVKHKNYIFSNGIDLIHELFNLERKTNNYILTKAIKKIGNNNSLNKAFTKIADKGIIF